MMIAKPLKQVTRDDLQRLIDEGIPESKTLEYKQELPGNTDGGPVKILRSITSFANTAGGDLLYGVAAKDGLPVELPGIHLPSQDAVVLRLESLCREGIDPRLPHLEYRVVPLDGDRAVLIVRVPRSWNAPHRVTAGNHAHFYGRNSAGAYQLDVGELRDAFTLSESITERIRSFRASRLLAIAENAGAVVLKDGAKVILHIVPLSAFVSSEMPISLQAKDASLLKMYPLGATGWDSRYTLEGYATFTGSNTPSRAYTLTYRNGIVEAVAVFSRVEGRAVIYSGYEKEVLKAFDRFRTALENLGIEYPFYVLLSFVGTAGYSMNDGYDLGEPFPRDTISPPEVMVPDSVPRADVVFKGIFDIVANAFGLPGSVNYDHNGNWAGK